MVIVIVLFAGQRMAGREVIRSAEKWKRKKLEDQPWYHATLPREDIVGCLKQDGEFLVRGTIKEARIQIILSVQHRGKILHFPINRSEDGWRWEGRGFESIYDLVHEHYKKAIPVTKASGAILRKAIKKNSLLIGHSDFRELQLLGSGAFGDVWLGKCKAGMGKWRIVAIKKCNKGAMTDEQRKAFLNEANIMQKYRHANVVRLIGVAADRPPIRLILEYCPGGALSSFLVDRKGQIRLEDKVRFAVEAARGMEYLSSKGCVHRDLAARNCLIGRDDSLKISDFGMSREGIYVMTRRKTVKMPVKWSSPETLTAGNWSSASDVFSFGVLIWEIFADGAMPWPDAESNKEVYRLILSGQRMSAPPGTPNTVKELMMSCWNLKIDNRPSFTHAREILDQVALRHPTIMGSSLKTQFTDRSSATH